MTNNKNFVNAVVAMDLIIILYFSNGDVLSIMTLCMLYGKLCVLSKHGGGKSTRSHCGSQ